MKLSVAQIGNSFGYMIFYFLLPEFYKLEVFTPSLTAIGLESLLNTITFSIITIPFAISAVMYIFAGYLSDRTRTRFGKRRPFLLLVIPAAVCYILLGLNPSIFIAMGFPLNFIVIILLATGYAVLYRIIYCAYWSFYMDITEPKERVNTSVVFNLFGMIGTIAAFVVPTFLSDIESYFSLLIIVGLAYMALVLFVFFLGPKEDLERIKEIDARGVKQPGFLQSLKESVKNKNFKYYMILSFFYTVGYSLITTIFIDFLTYKELYIPVEFWQVFLVLIPVAIFAFYLYGKLAKKWTKIKAFKFGLAIGFIVQPFMIFLAVQGPPIFLLIEILIVFGLLLFVLISILTFQYAILMDITPPEKEATYSGIYLFVTVIGMPVASAMIGPISDTINKLGPIFNFWTYNQGFVGDDWVKGHDFTYALFILIASALYLLTFFLLGKVKYKEPEK
ncbi:MAG: MFS transporter [Candidatus Lokiarchaeota archaeon]|nr:MFS transporter [Candidatus Lokiarchaeota archaeon]